MSDVTEQLANSPMYCIVARNYDRPVSLILAVKNDLAGSALPLEIVERTLSNVAAANLLFFCFFFV